MFIVVEGIDGTGKSTLAHALAAALEQRLGPGKVVLTREPTTESPWGRRLRRSETEGRLSKADEIDHFHRDRLHHLDTVIRPALRDGKTVICDRYVDSTLAYQAADPHDAARLYDTMKDALRAPDIILMLDCPVEVALERIAGGRQAKTTFEAEATLRRARDIYLSRADASHVVLDAAKAPAQILSDALDVLELRFPTLRQT